MKTKDSLKINKDLMVLLKTLQKYDVSAYEMIGWMVYRLETVLADIEDEIEEGDAERIDGILSELNMLSWRMADPDLVQDLLADMRKCGIDI